MKLLSTFAALTIAAILVSGAALASPAASATAGESAKAASGEKTTTHEVSGTIVSVDAKAKTLTLKDDKGQEHTAPCMGNAIKEMASLKAGDKVTCTCKDSAKGEHLGVTAIKVTK